MRERGSALLTSVIAIMVLLMISGVFFTFINYQFKLETSEEKGLRAFYTAEAGVNYGVAKVRSNPETYFNDTQFLTQTQLGDVPNTPFGPEEGTFDLFLQVSPPETSPTHYIFTLTSIGYYPNKQNGIKRSLQEQYTFPKPIQP